MRFQFENYVLDTGRFELVCDKAPLSLRPLAFSVLAYLVEHRDRVVSKDELFEQVWPDQYVSDDALSSCIKAIRLAVNDDGRAQRVIRTIRGHGYRFVAEIEEWQERPTPSSSLFSENPMRVSDSPHRVMVGRERELEVLHDHFVRALEGERQLVFISGEAGIGKTTLVDAFVKQIQAETVWIGRGQCIEQYGTGEAYLPILEALGRLGRSVDGEHLVDILRRQAMSWLLHLPALSSDEELGKLQLQGGGAMPQRMLRELAEALEMLTTEHPLVLILEDVHWCDISTMECLAYMARRHDAARLLVISTYRPVEAAVQDVPVHRVLQALTMRGEAIELPLPYLPETAVISYITQRLGDGASVAKLSTILHRRTTGNPFFMVNVVDDIIRQGLLDEQPDGWILRDGVEAHQDRVPDNIQQFIEQHLIHLSTEAQTVLGVASVVGMSFDTASVAAGVDRTAEEIEDSCYSMARQGLFVKSEETETWPDGTLSTRFSFLHGLYREALYTRLAPGHRLRLHRQVGLRKKAGYGEQAQLIAVELADHFVRAQVAEEALPYLRQAAQNAMYRSAYREAMQHLTLGFEVLQTLAETPKRVPLELALQLTYSQALVATEGSWSPNVEQAYRRALDLCVTLGRPPQLFPVLVGLLYFYSNRAQTKEAQELVPQVHALADALQEPSYLLVSQFIKGTDASYQGELSTAYSSYKEGLSIYDAQPKGASAFLFGQNPGIQTQILLAILQWRLGYADQALQLREQAQTLSATLAHPPTLAYVLYHSTVLFQELQDIPSTMVTATALIDLATQEGFERWVHIGQAIHGWCLVVQGEHDLGLQRLEAEVERVRATGAVRFMLFFWLLIADAKARVGQIDDGLNVIADAEVAVKEIPYPYFEPDVYHLKGELLLQRDDAAVSQATSCFQHAIAVARHQQAKALELRAALSQSRLWYKHGQQNEACQLLGPIVAWFTEGFTTTDLMDARAFMKAAR